MTQKLTPTSGVDQVPAALPVTTGQTATAQIPCLPDEMWLHIFTNFTAPETLTGRLVCRNWHQLMEDDSLWRFFLGRDFQPSKTDKPKELYQRNYRTNPNLIHGIYATTTFTLTETIGYWYICTKGGKLIAPNRAGDIEIWDLKNGTPLNTFKNKNDGDVLSLIVTEEGKVVASYAIGEIKLWDLKTGQCERTLSYPTHPMIPGLWTGEVARQLISENEKTLISVDDDRKVTIWDLETCKIAQTFMLNAPDWKSVNPWRSGPSEIKCLIMTKEGNLISGEPDGRILIWDREGKCIKTLLYPCRGFPIALVLTKDGKLISRYEGIYSHIAIWNLETGECEMSMPEDLSAMSSLALSKTERILISGSDKKITFWDLEMTESEAMLTPGSDEELTFWDLQETKSEAILTPGSDEGELRFGIWRRLNRKQYLLPDRTRNLRFWIWRRQIVLYIA